MLKNDNNLLNKYYLKYKLFILYSIGGAIAFIVDFGLLYLLTEFVGLWYLVSTTISVTVAIITNYSWQRIVTFKSDDHNIAKQFSKFVIISTVAIGLNILLMYLLVDLVGLWYLLAKIFVTMLVWFWNFFGNKYFTFKVKQSNQNI